MEPEIKPNSYKKPLSVLILSVLGIMTFFLHGQILQRPIIGQHDFISGSILTTTSIWLEEGILKHSLTPVYSFNSDIPYWDGWGVQGKNGRMYYVSYPSGTNVFLYLLGKIPFVGLTDITMRFFGYGLFVVTFLLFTYYIYTNYGRFAAIVSTAAFAFFPLSAYYLGGFFIYDTAFIPFWLSCFLAFKSILAKPSKKNIFLFFLFLFLVSYIEWIGLFIGFTVFLLLFFRSKKIQVTGKPKKILMLGSLLVPTSVLPIMFFTYSRQIETKALINQWLFRFLYRTDISNAGLPLFWKNIDRFFNYLHFCFNKFILVFIILSLVLILISNIKRLAVFRKKEILPELAFFFFPPLLHMVSLSNFHFEHDLGHLYILFAVILIIVWGFMALRKLSARYLPKRFPLICDLIALLLFIIFLPTGGKSTYEYYYRKWLWYPKENLNYYYTIRNMTTPHDLVLTDLLVSPLNWYYLRRNAVGALSLEEALSYLKFSSDVNKIYYFSDVETFDKTKCQNENVTHINSLFICQLK